MIKKIILMILILISINNVNCESGSIETYISSSSDNTENVRSGGDVLSIRDVLFRLNHDTGAIPDSYSIDGIQIRNYTIYETIPTNLGDPFYIYWSSDAVSKDLLVGYGVFYIHKTLYAGNNNVNASILIYFDEFTKKPDESGMQYYILSGDWSGIGSYYSHYYYDDQANKINLYYDAINSVISMRAPNQNTVFATSNGWKNSKHEYDSFGTFKNDYNYTVTTSYIDINIQRQGFSESYGLNSSHIKMVNITDSTTYYESSDTTLNTSHFLNIGNYNYYIVRQIDDYEHLIYTSEEEEEEEQPTLTTDKTYYNTSELINISFTNINKIYDECTSSFCNEPYQLWIYALNTPNIPKFRQWLYSDRRDESFTLNTSILSPQTDYQLMITSGESNIVISSDIFYVYQADEYLSVSCDADVDCITYNGIKNIIYYKINNNSNIIIKDNDNNIINTYYNIIGNGSIIYTIPDDLYHANTYPNWKVYLNNTEYSTSFNKGITVYWSQFQTPTATPIYTPTPTPDINISDTIDEFKTETQPIKDLIFGLSEIVIDNPDYNKDNIIDESEINHWFNSLIPICIIFLLIILYVGLKKKRE